MLQKSAVASVVIPAHNEAQVVLRCLRALLEDATPGEFEVVVAANGCTDDTADVVRASGIPVRCLELAAPGKIAALNAADGVCSTFPRIYCDADVVLDTATARTLVDRLDVGDTRAASPAMALDTTGTSPWMRSYYRVWRRLPVLGEGYVGSGVYALDRAGHDRVFPLPDILNDDEFVRVSFAADERATSAGEFTVRPARTLEALLRRAARTRRGRRQLASTSSAGPAESGDWSARPLLVALASRPRSWPDLFVFVATTALVRVNVAFVSRRTDTWGRDTGSRQEVSPS